MSNKTVSTIKKNQYIAEVDLRIKGQTFTIFIDQDGQFSKTSDNKKTTVFSFDRFSLGNMSPLNEEQMKDVLNDTLKSLFMGKTDLSDKSFSDFYNKTVDYPCLIESALTPDTYFLALSSCGNPDHYQDPNQELSPAIIKMITSKENGESIVREYISEYDLGGGNYTGGCVFKNGKLVGYYSYNGRLWAGLPFRDRDTQEKLNELP